MPEARAAMSGSYSLYLDVLRLLAALVVLVSHAARQAQPARVGWLPDSLGHNAVGGVFVLSGDVIA